MIIGIGEISRLRDHSEGFQFIAGDLEQQRDLFSSACSILVHGDVILRIGQPRIKDG